jgi:predicted double-glycine peptidase
MSIKFLQMIFSAAFVMLQSGCSGVSLESALQRSEKFSPWEKFRWESIQRQKFDYSCGASALATIGKYYFGDNITEDIVLAILIKQLTPKGLLDRQANGFSFLDLKKAAGHLGYYAEGVILKIEDIAKLKGPVIIPMNDGSTEHFVVLKGIIEDRAYIADPIRGNIRIPVFQLVTQWQGNIVLALGKPDFGLPEEHGLAVKTPIVNRPETSAARQMMSRSSAHL